MYLYLMTDLPMLSMLPGKHSCTDTHVIPVSCPSMTKDAVDINGPKVNYVGCLFDFVSLSNNLSNNIG